MKASVLYVSKTGHTAQMAEEIVCGMQQLEGMEAKAFSIDEIDEAWAKESQCIIVGTPVYLASVSSALVSWLQGPCVKYGLAGKIGGAFATADYVHGGGELAIRTIFDHLLVHGMLTYSGGGFFGKPVIHLGPVAITAQMEECKETFQLYGKRMAQKTMELFA